ncbi:hypothetical protein IE81DRAFT_34580 [Ceraceosorus guamensis]|uniref:Apple domain-containing protein n=1 Tax=Ceraceosorus guamensis TaxID=1522189 RepID=A0A316VQI0_9BASI|nr:hypothetical protein IE81DRAFT_34580 [Ceraceosorus guamensis]PWN39318.1 hypothetical protein IE81DRAFT_34580 [Ceraceosorus guamensis]
MLATQIVRQAHLAILVALTTLALSENVHALPEQEALAERAIGGRSSKTYTFTQRACTTLLGSKAVRPVPTATTTKLSVTVGFPIFEYAKPTITVTPAATTTTTTSTVTSTSTVNNPANTDTATETDTITTTTTVTETSTTQTQLPEVTITTTVTPTTTLVLPNFTPAASAPGLQGHTYARRGLGQLEAARPRIPRALSGSSRAESLNELAARATGQSLQLGPNNTLQYSNKKKCYPQSVKCKKAIEKVAVTTYTVAGKRTVTRAAPTPTSTSEVTTTVTSTTTIQPSDATTTVTVTTTNTQTSTTSTTTTETLPATTKTETAQAPLVTVNAACQANNLIRSVDNVNIGQVDVNPGSDLDYSGGATASSPEACCAACASSATCQTFAHLDDNCYMFKSRDGRCSANESGSLYYTNQNSPGLLTVGNGPCGYANFGGRQA